MTLCFGLAVMAAVMAGKRMPIYERSGPIS